MQAILFLNRRGFAPSLICESCGTIVHCPNCAVALTLHRSRGEHVRCHYCDYVAHELPSCQKCKGTRLSQEGVGTERIEQALVDAFPGVRVARLDRDVAGGLKSERILNAMRDGEVDILVGTQMVTKGHDLPRVALVGVLNADAALSLPDYQAAERTFQLLVQVAGRAGRGSTQGQVIIQTRNPDHPAVRCALLHDVEAFVEYELRERQDANYPPYCRLLMARVDALDDAVARKEMDRVVSIMRRAVGNRAEVLGPSPAPIERLRNRYRFRCMVRGAARAPLYEAARAALSLVIDRRARLTIDVDPVAML
jgi:primosomal protein N' (replication factor Y)